VTGESTLAVASTKNWSWTNEYNLQLPAAVRRDSFPDISHGEYLLLEADHDGVTVAVFGKVDLVDTGHLEDGEVGIGINLRYALGVDVGDDVRVREADHPETGLRRLGARVDEWLGRRPVLCRVRKGVLPDIGFDICRLSESAMDDIGVSPGDRVVVESKNERVSLKAFPLREDVSDRKGVQTDMRPDRYPEPVEALGLDRLAGTEVDLPAIYLDAERRQQLQLGEQTNADGGTPLDAGICQPVKVFRDPRSAFLRSLNGISISVIVGLLATVVFFEPWLTPLGMLAIIGVGLFFVVFSVVYQVRWTVFK